MIISRWKVMSPVIRELIASSDLGNPACGYIEVVRASDYDALRARVEQVLAEDPQDKEHFCEVAPKMLAAAIASSMPKGGNKS